MRKAAIASTQKKTPAARQRPGAVINTRKKLMSMWRIIDGQVYEGKPSPDRYRVTLRDLGHGHREASVNRAIDWTDVGPLHPDSRAAQILRGEIDDPDAEAKREANIRRAARRAKSAIRQRCKAQGLDSLLTLTYKANQTDRALCEAHLKAFLRRLRAAIPGFAYVAFFEPQKRGAWHVHMAVRKLPRVISYRGTVTLKSFNVVRAIWRSVVGEFGGNIDAGQWKNNARKSAAKCAAYISKYCLKTYADGEMGSKRYRASSVEMPQVDRMQFQAASLAELIDLVVSFVGEGGRELATSWLSPFKDCYFVASERPS